MVPRMSARGALGRRARKGLWFKFRAGCARPTRPDGTKEVIALEDGYRESAESWRTLLRDLKRRGLRAPVLAVGDGALGFWAALRNVWPETAEQRCWVHQIANVLDKLLRSLQPRAKQALHEIMYADTRATAEREIACSPRPARPSIRRPSAR
jgi:transposase-like protein